MGSHGLREVKTATSEAGFWADCAISGDTRLSSGPQVPHQHWTFCELSQRQSHPGVLGQWLWVPEKVWASLGEAGQAWEGQGADSHEGRCHRLHVLAGGARDHRTWHCSWWCLPLAPRCAPFWAPALGCFWGPPGTQRTSETQSQCRLQGDSAQVSAMVTLACVSSISSPEEPAEGRHGP